MPKIWERYVQRTPELASLDGHFQIQRFVEWVNGRCGSPQPATDGDGGKCMSGVIAVPLLVILQLSQYYHFLHLSELSHEQFLRRLCDDDETWGNVQGYCSGFLVAAAIASSRTEDELNANATAAINLSIGVGAYSDVMNLKHDRSNQANLLTVLLDRSGQEKELLSEFQQIYASVKSDALRVSFMGPAPDIQKLHQVAKDRGLSAAVLDVRGRWHCPGNEQITDDFYSLCQEHQDMQLTGSTNALRTRLRSNADGTLLVESTSLTKEAIFSIMVRQCNWGMVIDGAIQDLYRRSRGVRQHSIAVFGTGDCVSRDSIQGTELQLTKQEISKLFSRSVETVPSHNSLDYVRPPVICAIGLACRFPGAEHAGEFWDVISEGKSQCRAVPTDRIDFSKSSRLSTGTASREDTQSRFFGNFLSQIDGFDHQFFKVAPKEAIAMDPQQRLLLETAYQAVQSAGLGNPKDIYGKNVGVFIGIGNNDYMEHNCSNTATAFSLTGTLRAFLCGKISHYFGWTGPSETIDTACSSSGVAINRACRALASGECDYALVGGVNTISSPNTYIDLSVAGFLSPTGPCKPFSVDVDGYCRGEGVGLILLQRLDDAVRDGNEVHAVLPGYGVNQSGREGAITAPNAKSQEALFRTVLDRSRLDANQIQYVEAHGTGTQLGDKVECQSIKQVFHALNFNKPLYLGSVKANIGHTEPASGAASLIKAILMIQHREIPPHINFSVLNDKLGLDTTRFDVTTSTKPLSPGVSILVNNYGAAGSNAAFIVSSPENYLSNYDKTPLRKVPMYRAFYPVVLSSHSHRALQAQMTSLRQYLSTGSPTITLQRVAYTLAKRLVRQRYSWTASVDSIAKLCSDLSNAASGSSEITDTSEVPLQKLVLVFGGQRSKFVGLVHEIYDHLPALRRHLDACDKLVSELLGQSIFPAIFQTTPIEQVALLQCALFSMQYASARMWIDTGARVDRLVGHSFGEITAFCVSGALSPRDALRFIIDRAALLERIQGDHRGAMLSIQGAMVDYEACQEKLPEPLIDQVGIACYNAPNQFVISGSLEAINTFEAEQSSSRMKCKRLDVTHGFHSPVLDPLRPDLIKLAESLSLRPAQIPLELCTAEGLEKPSLTDLANNTRNPVYFTNAIGRIESRLGPSCTWMEMGLYSGMTSLVQKSCQQLHLNQHRFIPGMDKKYAFSPTIANQVLQLWRSGQHLSWWSHEEGGEELKDLPLPPYAFDHTRHWMPLNLEPRSSGSRMDNVERRKPALVTIIQDGDERSSNDTFKFMVDCSSPIYQSMLHGHVVVQQPLTPASMYLECIASGLNMIQQQQETRSLPFALEFRDVEITASLGSRGIRQVTFTLNRTYNQSWDISFHSLSDNATNWTDHMRGSVKLVKGGVGGREGGELGSEFDGYARLCKLRMEEMQHGSGTGTEVLRQTKAYQLFSRVVNYSKHLQGISTIYTSDQEACADIALEMSPDSTVIHPAAVDNFLQVAGLLINTHPSCDDDFVYLATQLSKLGVIGQKGGSSNNSTSWKVYATISTMTSHRAACDVFVFDAHSGMLTAYIFNAQFTKLALTTLSRLLSGSASSLHKPHNESYMSVPHLRQTAETSGSGSDSEVESVFSDMKSSSSAEDTPSNVVSIEDLAKIFETYAAGELPSRVARDTAIDSFGVDSLSAIELCRDIADLTHVELEMTEFSQHETLGSLLDSVNARLQPRTLPKSRKNLDTAYSPNPVPRNGIRIVDQNDTAAAGVKTHNPIAVTNSYKDRFSYYARLHQFERYGEQVQSFQTDATVALILEMLVSLGIDLDQLAVSQPIPELDNTILPRHAQLMQRLWTILEGYGLITRDDDKSSSLFYRSSKPIQLESAKSLLDRLIADFPQHAEEHRLLSITGLKLAECLSGTADPIKLLFHDPVAVDLMGAVYRNAPMFATMTSMLLDVIDQLFASASGGSDSDSNPIRILEIGAGLGGTTAGVLERLQTSRRKVQYTFTDISPTFVAKARKRFTHYHFLSFQVLDIEKEITDASLRGHFDLILATNVIHATKDLPTAMAHIRSLLSENGSAILSEIIHGPDWLDLVWGLLEGWWRFEDGRSYALQSVDDWARVFRDAGFGAFASSGGNCKESQMQQLLVGSVQPSAGASKTAALSASASVSRSISTADIEPVSYKHVDGLDLMVDIYWPKQNTSENNKPIGECRDYCKYPFCDAMSHELIHSFNSTLALMIHGGGHMMLSKKAIRPYQCKYLLEQGFVPIAINYRLCPETTLGETIQDVLDCLQWARSTLPNLAHRRGLQVDASNIVAVGWSSGGHLAMSLGWTAIQAHVAPPSAVLAFYPPTDYESGHWWNPIDDSTRNLEPTMSMDEIIGQLRKPRKPLQEYHVAAQDMEHAEEGWVSLGDPRSELVLHSVRDGLTIPLLLHGLGGDPGNSNVLSSMPSKDELAAISPLHYVRTGTYQIPTYLIHGTGDKLVPVEMSVALHEALKQQGIDTGLTQVPETSHTFDMFLRPGDRRWNEYVQPGMDFLVRCLEKRHDNRS
ncbi:polyketide synthase protein [Penicillium lagena]|uniref:polyketide synthase protein n=1 Tax=Penicillium lagena TaxID=94218 RepID=UPI0025410342|nr:polyketide synthase protein [Penicillium lagena]KAJ5610338.1 polyketide synthase protein [Penicillium lagena]